MTGDLITDHVWRSPLRTVEAKHLPLLERPCDYMNCRRPRDEHERSTSGVHRRKS